MLIVLFVLGCALALLGRARAVKWRETAALEAMPPQYGRPTPTGPACPWPLSRVLGKDFFQHVRSLQAWSYDSAACRRIADFPYLERLHVKVDDLFGPRLTNSDLASCRSLKHLDELYVEGRCFNGDALSHFAQSRPRRVVLRFLRCDGSGLRHLNPANLETLSLYRMPVTDEGLRSLQAFRNLRHLEIHGGQVTPRGLGALAELPRLELLVLTNLPLDDDCLAELPRSLRQLSLRDVAVTDHALEHLAGLPLERWELANTRITATGIERMRQRLPDGRARTTSSGIAGGAEGLGVEIERLFRAYPR